MALFQPSNITPSSFAGVGGGVVDTADKAKVSWQLNGSSPLVGYCIDSYIKQNDGTYRKIGHYPITGDLSNDLGIQLKSVDPPVYPADAKGNPNVFTAEFINNSGDTIDWAASLEMTNGGEYAFYITQCWKEGTSLKTITQVAPSAVITRTTPLLFLDHNGSTLAKAIVKGTYIQDQHDSIAWVRWRLFCNDELIDDTFPVATSLLEYEFEGLLTRLTYTAECTIETSSGQVVSATTSITYLSKETNGGDWSLACNAPYTSLINNDTIKMSIPESYKNCGIINKWLGFDETSENAYIDWTNIEYLMGTKVVVRDILNFHYYDGYYIYLRCKVVNGLKFYFYNQSSSSTIYTGIYTSSDNKTITVENRSGIITQKHIFSVSVEDVIIEIDGNERVVYIYDTTTGSLIQGESLSYLGTITINWVEITADNTIPSGVPCVAGVAISLSKLTLSTDMFQDKNPSWNDNGVKFLTNFAGGRKTEPLNAGDIKGVKSTAVFYRRDKQSEKLFVRLGAASQLRDYGTRSNRTYTYELKNLNDDIPILYSDLDLTPTFNAYYLIEGKQVDSNEKNVFHVVRYWVFGNNILAGSIGNNNTPNWLSNFTGYRLRQASSRRGKSGTLQALLSNVSNAVYSDSAQLMDSLYAASLSSNTFFLKDMKGNIYMVAISAPITQTINTKSNIQEVTVSIPWEEIGSMKNIVLIQTPDDENWDNPKQN